jgi:DNA-binding CsgD family transcriptional regulator
MDAPMERRLRAVMDVAYGGDDDGDDRWPALLAALHRVLQCERLSLLELDHAGGLVAHRDYPRPDVAISPVHAAEHRWPAVCCASRVGAAAGADRYGVATVCAGSGVQIEMATNARLVFWRPGRDFSVHERLLIGVLRPHLDAVYRDGLRQRGALTARQQQILTLVAHGCTNAEVAMRLGLSVGTVRKHLDNVYATMRVTTRAAAVARFARA